MKWLKIGHSLGKKTNLVLSHFPPSVSEGQIEACNENERYYFLPSVLQQQITGCNDNTTCVPLSKRQT